jgi:hypothetical protein
VLSCSGNTVVGWYLNDLPVDYRGFRYDGATWIALDMPRAISTQVGGISGNTLVGTYQDSSHHQHGFVYENSTWSTLDIPGVSQTVINDIDADNIVGSALGEGFCYNMTIQTWNTLNAPGAVHGSTISGISGNNLVGWYLDASLQHHGFLYDGTNWTTLDYPGASTTLIYGIDGNNIVGTYTDADSKAGGCFIYTIPEPATLLLLGLGALLLRKR